MSVRIEHETKKVERVITEEVKTTKIVLELTPEQAVVIHMLIGAIGGSNKEFGIRDYLSPVHTALSDYIPLYDYYDRPFVAINAKVGYGGNLVPLGNINYSNNALVKKRVDALKNL